METRYCPKCRIGILEKKPFNKREAYFCSNCDYVNQSVLSVETGKVCPKCGDYLVLKISRNKKRFWACHNSDCDYRE